LKFRSFISSGFFNYLVKSCADSLSESAFFIFTGAPQCPAVLRSPVRVSKVKNSPLSEQAESESFRGKTVVRDSRKKTGNFLKRYTWHSFTKNV
jgi:hypothetical protein